MTNETREAGRALDAIIAERVMGWRCERKAPYPAMSEQARLMCWHREGIAAPRNCPRFSKDSAAAFLVVEKMRELAYHFRLDYSGVAYATFCHLSDETGNALGEFTDSVPLAICLAALAALESGSPL